MSANPLLDELNAKLATATHEWIRDCGLEVDDVQAFIDRDVMRLIADYQAKLQEEPKEIELAAGLVKSAELLTRAYTDSLKPIMDWYGTLSKETKLAITKIHIEKEISDDTSSNGK